MTGGPLTLPKRGEPSTIPRPSRSEAEAAVRTLIRWAGDDPDREGLKGTPDRVARAYEEFYAGYGELSIGCSFGPDRGDWSYQASALQGGPNEHS